MTSVKTSRTIKKLAFQSVLENIDTRKRSLFLQEIISLGKEDTVWIKVLNGFFNSPLKNLSVKSFSRN
jgi:hypothetical protein